MRSPLAGPAVPLLALTAAASLILAGCSSGTSADAPAATPSVSTTTTVPPSPSSTVQVPAAQQLTEPGSKLSFGDAATVIFESTDNKGTVLKLQVRSVRKGRLEDFKGFILDDSYKKQASYYYAKVRVSNVGEGDVGGARVPLWGVNAANTLLPSVKFTTRFPRCASPGLPKDFGPGDSLSTCLVFLSPDRGALRAVSYRPNQAFNPITWTGEIADPPPTKAPGKKPGKKPGKAPSAKG